MRKKIGNVMTVEFSDEGWPHWTRLKFDSGNEFIMDHEEARDLHYAMTRVVAFLDEKEAIDRARRITTTV